MLNWPKTAADVLSPDTPTPPKEPLPSACPYATPNCTEAEALVEGSYL